MGLCSSDPGRDRAYASMMVQASDRTVPTTVTTTDTLRARVTTPPDRTARYAASDGSLVKRTKSTARR